MKRGNMNITKRIIILPLYACLILIFLSVFSSALISLVNSSSITEKYSSNQNLRGEIILSLINEPHSTPIIAKYSPGEYSSNSTIKQLIEKNPTIPYNCSTLDCEKDYSSLSAGEKSKTLSLAAGQSFLLGLKIQDQDLESIDKLILNMTLNNPESCLSPIALDFGDDGTYDWFGEKSSNSLCIGEKYGCYSSSQSTIIMDINRLYCEEIEVSSSSALEVGAQVSGSGQANFTFSINDYNCQASALSSGKIGCRINLTITEKTKIPVCIEQKSGDYSLYYESTDPICGYSEGSSYDFSIFVKTFKFGTLGAVSINSTSQGEDFGSILDVFVRTKYDNDCSGGCFLPFRILSNLQNTISLNSASLSYKIGLGGKTTDLLYSLESQPSKINMLETGLTLDNIGLTVPNSSGNYDLTLKIGDQVIFRQIEVISIPILEQIYPTEVPAGVEVEYHVLLSPGSNATLFKWYFDDNSTIETTTPDVKHKYPIIGRHIVIVSASNSNGEANKSFYINAIQPWDYLNYTLFRTANNLQNIKSELNTFPAVIKNYFNRLLNITNLEFKVSGMQAELELSKNDSMKQIELLNRLFSLNVPNNVKLKKEESAKLNFNTNLVNLQNMKTLAGETVISGTQEQISANGEKWFKESLDVDVETKVYSLAYTDIDLPIATLVNLKITQKEDISKIYMIINKPKDRIEAPAQNSLISLSSATGIELERIAEKQIELVFKSEESASNLPVYIFPSLTEIEVKACNNNNVCESELGENSNNCRSDCTPWLFIISLVIGIIILLSIMVFVIRFILKRRYEAKLFKNKDELFNLSNFMLNASSQEKTKEEIYKILKEKSWNNNQLDYAWKNREKQRVRLEARKQKQETPKPKLLNKSKK